MSELLHKNRALYWRWLISVFHQPQTIDMLKQEIESLQLILKQMEQGEL